MTPEQRERIRAHLRHEARDARRHAEASSAGPYIAACMENAEACEAALALLTPEAEADRRLGQLARACWGDFVGALDVTADALEVSPYRLPGHPTLNQQRAATLRAFAAALREEAGR